MLEACIGSNRQKSRAVRLLCTSVFGDDQGGVCDVSCATEPSPLRVPLVLERVGYASGFSLHHDRYIHLGHISGTILE